VCLIASSCETAGHVRAARFRRLAAKGELFVLTGRGIWPEVRFNFNLQYFKYKDPLEIRFEHPTRDRRPPETFASWIPMANSVPCPAAVKPWKTLC
jgi:hypothetical protein